MIPFNAKNVHLDVVNAFLMEVAIYVKINLPLTLIPSYAIIIHALWVNINTQQLVQLFVILVMLTAYHAIKLQIIVLHVLSTPLLV